MKKENKKPLILWALVALVLGVILGLVITNLSTTGKAKSALGLDSGRQEANLEESRNNLTLDLLRVNRIENRGNNQLQLNSTNGIMMISPNTIGLESENAIKLNVADQSFISLYSDYENQFGPQLQIKSHRVGFVGNHIAFSNTQGETSISINPDSEITINAPVTIGASTKFNQLVNDVEVPWGLYSVGDSFNANTYLITVINILDANNTAVLNFAKEDDISTDYYATEGDIILGLIEVGPIDSSYVQLRQILSGNAYACLTADGTLYRSYNPCN